MAKKGFEETFGRGEAEFLTPLSERKQGKEPGPQELLINQQSAPDPLDLVDSIPSSPLRKLKGA
jgi:hypothetical protein